MKNAVVTGGGSGIGRAIAQRLRADGLHVATIDLVRTDDDFAHTADVTEPARSSASTAAETPDRRNERTPVGTR